MIKTIATSIILLILYSLIVLHLLYLAIIFIRFEFVEEIYKESSNRFFAMYNTCVYFSVVTLTTVGYGDIGPTETLSRIFTLLLEFFGIALYGYAMQKVTFIVDRTQVEEIAKEEKVSRGITC